MNTQNKDKMLGFLIVCLKQALNQVGSKELEKDLYKNIYTALDIAKYVYNHYEKKGGKK